MSSTTTTSTTLKQHAGKVLSSAEELCIHANAYAAAHGLQVETKQQQQQQRSSTSKSTSTFQCAPISLLPNAYPKTAFVRAQSLAKPMNLLVDRISRNAPFLRETLGGDVSRADPFTAKLLTIYENVYATDEGSKGSKGTEWGKFARSADCLGVHRSDYMLHPKEQKGEGEGEGDAAAYELKQVELNTIASSFAGLAVQVAGLHRYLVQRFSGLDQVTQEEEEEEDGGGGLDLAGFLQANVNTVMGTSQTKDADSDKQPPPPAGVPINPALQRIPLAMSIAHQRYQTRFHNHDAAPSPPLVILFVVQSGETNTVDQRMLEFQLYQTHSIPVVRLSLTDAHQRVHLDQDTGALYITSSSSSSSSSSDERKRLYEVSVIYYRAGYSPADYSDNDAGPEWTARETMERSRATKCPNVGYHLAGTKKVQQELARAGVVERFLSSKDDDDHNHNNDNDKEETTVVKVRGAFAGLYSLGSDATSTDKHAVLDALQPGREGRYVLKPQREGGGNNYYGKEMVSMLEQNVTIIHADTDAEVDGKEVEFDPALGEFILMQRLFPPQQRSVLLRGGQVEGQGESISELGCFGTLVVSGGGGGEEEEEREVVHNEYAGFLLRTKFMGVDEGGVASGFATLSSPYLC